MESTIALAMLLQKFDVELKGSPESVELVTGATIHTKNETYLDLQGDMAQTRLIMKSLTNISPARTEETDSRKSARKLQRAYTMELEAEVAKLKEENQELQKKQLYRKDIAYFSLGVCKEQGERNEAERG